MRNIYLTLSYPCGKVNGGIRLFAQFIGTRDAFIICLREHIGKAARFEYPHGLDRRAARLADGADQFRGRFIALQQHFCRADHGLTE